MNTPEEKTNPVSTELSRIYKTDSFGFPIYPADEETYIRDKESHGVNPEAASVVVESDTIDSVTDTSEESNLNM